MRKTDTFGHDGATYRLTWTDTSYTMKGTLRCVSGEREVWSRTILMLEDSNAFMLRMSWRVSGGVVTLNTEGEHLRGASIHQRRLHSMSRGRFLGTKDL